MKTKHIFLLFILGSIVGGVGVLFRIQHWPGANIALTCATVLMVIFWILIIWKAFTHPKLRDFMNK